MSKLEDFAALKRLPLDFLAKHGVTDHNGKIRFANGTAGARLRTNVETSHPTLWAERGATIRAYGFDRLAAMRAWGDTLLIVEGESDALTAWLHQRPALGIPGAGMAQHLRLDDVERFARCVVLRDVDKNSGKPDTGGKVFPENVATQLREVGYAGAIDAAELRSTKDLSELHLKHERDCDFDDALDDAIARAAQVGVAAETQTIDEPEWDDAAPVPVLHDDARYGLAGEILKAVEEQTEAHPAAILFTLLAGVGNAAGPGVRAMAGNDSHPARLSVLVVAETAAGKGQSLAIVRPILSGANADWWDRSYCSGFNSGEGMIARLSGVHDAGDATAEKRAFIVEPEFVRVLEVGKRDGTTLSAIVRQAWDDGRLESTRRNDSLKVTDAHVSIIGHITPSELREKLIGSDLVNGFANRLLFVNAYRVLKLPSGGHVEPAIYGQFARRVSEALQVGDRVLGRAAAAEELWDRLYRAEPEPGGVLGAVVGRSAAQRLRLAVVYAILDCAHEIRVEHVRAAEAAWRYCYDSAQHIFGAALADPTETRILDALRDAYPDGLDANELRELWHQHKPAANIRAACASLEGRGLIRSARQPTQGRARIMRFACVKSVKSVKSPPAPPLTTHNTLFTREQRDTPEGATPIPFVVAAADGGWL